jgi:hypothetical protein
MFRTAVMHTNRPTVRPIARRSQPTVSKIARRIYVPLTSLLLAIAVGNWLASATEGFDPMTAAQDNRVKLAGRDLLVTGGPLGLTAAEIKQLSSVSEWDAPVAQHERWVLYLGNSQTLMISDPTSRDLTSAQWLELLSERKPGHATAVRLGGLGSLRVPEMLIRFVAASELHRKPDVLVLALLLDEFRELSVRPEVARLAGTAAVNAAVRKLVSNNAELPDAAQALASVLERQSDSAGKEAKKPFAARIEDRLQSVADQHWHLFAARPTLVAQSFLTFLDARNKVFGITSADVRPVRPPVFEANFELLEMLLRYARARNIPVVMYLAPVRHARFSPDAAMDLDQLREDALAMCQKYAVPCADYMELVPEKFWTTYYTGGLKGQRDFAHFTGEGHKLIGERLAKDFGATLFPSPAREVGW